MILCVTKSEKKNQDNDQYDTFCFSTWSAVEHEAETLNVQLKVAAGAASVPLPLLPDTHEELNPSTPPSCPHPSRLLSQQARGELMSSPSSPE